jgi:ribonuclease Y
MTDWETKLVYAVLPAVGAGLYWLLLVVARRSARSQCEREASVILEKARSDAETIVRESKLAANEQALRLLEDTEKSFAARRSERAELERRLTERESLINLQLQRVVDAERSVDEQKREWKLRAEQLRETESKLAERERAGNKALEKIAGLSAANAREIVLNKAEREAAGEAQALASSIIEKAKASADERARYVISTAIQRYAGEHTFQTTTTTVTLTSEDIKGRIIGREGRNIRAFEAATGVTVLIDDTPGAVLLSGFDPVRREIAREAMARLINDGRIHPTRIEEIVAQVAQETNATIQRLGEDAVLRSGVAPLAPDLLTALGRLHFRHSYSQNILEHSVEVAHLTGLMAAELGMDVALAKRTGLLHDIGKAVSHELEGPHAIVGAEMIKRCGESEAVVNGVASHHNDVPSIGPLGILVSAADAISASRPGARSENMTTYLRRIDDLEKMALSFAGVEKAFAVHAGRELRVFVQPEAISDEAAVALARNITLKVENELQYPGQIKVVVIRETRCVELAR